MRANVLLNLLNELWKTNIYLFCNECNKFNNARAEC